MTHYENHAAQDDADERYYVTLDNGQVELMTLEELDAAFQDDRITQDTLVCLVGATEWQPLSALAGLDEDEGSEASQEPTGTAEYSESPAPNHWAPQPSVLASPAPALAVQAPQTVQALPAVQSVPAVQAIPAVPPTLAPVAHVTSRPISAVQHSLAPMVNDLSKLDDLDIDALSLRPKRNKAVIFGGIGLALAAVAVFVITATSGEAESAPVAAAAAPVATVATAEKPSSPTTAPEAPAKKDPAPEEAKAGGDEAKRLSDDVRSALLKADQGREKKATKKGRQVTSKRSGKASQSSGLRSTGSAYDPLNGKL